MNQTDPDSLMREAFADSVGFLLGRASQIFQDRMTKALSSLNLSLTDYACLRMISKQVADTQAALSEICSIDQATMVGLLDRLESQGLVVRERNPADRRSHKLVLTLKGGKMLARAQRLASNQQRLFLSVISAEEWQLVQACLSKLISPQAPADS